MRSFVRSFVLSPYSQSFYWTYKYIIFYSFNLFLCLPLPLLIYEELFVFKCTVYAKFMEESRKMHLLSAPHNVF